MIPEGVKTETSFLYPKIPIIAFCTSEKDTSPIVVNAVVLKSAKENTEESTRVLKMYPIPPRIRARQL